tara:strand:- start:1340 stop:1732 length:393 start_codon:yes stop_codon:yes gene_type:complete
MANKLTVKMQNFCYKYVETGNASEAYRQSYNAENMAVETIKSKACILLKKGNVRATVDGLLEEAKKRHEVTQDSITMEYEEARQAALLGNQPSAMVSATTGKAKIHGLLTEKVDINHTMSLSEILDAAGR